VIKSQHAEESSIIVTSHCYIDDACNTRINT